MLRWAQLGSLLIVLLLVGCNRANRQPIESDVFVAVQMNETDLEITCITEKSYECQNYGIRFRMRQVNDNKIRVELKDVVKPDECLTATGPATCLITSRDLAAGTYPVSFEMNGQTTEGTIVVSGGSATLTLDEGNVKVF